MKKLSLLFSLFFLTTILKAEIISREVQYQEGKTLLEGYVAFKKEAPSPMPAVLIVHDWMGLSESTQERAHQLAEMGYYAFAVDIYGKGVRPKDSQEASAQASTYKSNRLLLRKRIQAAYKELNKIKEVNTQKVAAIGYCFGGTTVLELARAGAPIAGVISFHGGLETPLPAKNKAIKAKILVLHGAEDPHVPDSEVSVFEAEMRKAGADWQLVKYSGAVHSFTNPKAGNDPSKGSAYHALADKRSWQAMQAFFAEIF